MKKILVITPPYQIKDEEIMDSLQQYFSALIELNEPIVFPSPEWKYEVVEIGEINVKAR